MRTKKLLELKLRYDRVVTEGDVTPVEVAACEQMCALCVDVGRFACWASGIV